MTLPRGLASYLWCTTQRDLGEYITVLDEREIEGNDGRMTELLLNFWAEESVAEEIRDLLHVSRNGPVEWANDGRLKLVRGSFAELAVFRPEIKRTCRLLYWWIVWEFIWYMSRSPREKWEWRVKICGIIASEREDTFAQGQLRVLWIFSACIVITSCSISSARHSAYVVILQIGWDTVIHFPPYCQIFSQKNIYLLYCRMRFWKR